MEKLGVKFNVELLENQSNISNREGGGAGQQSLVLSIFYSGIVKVKPPPESSNSSPRTRTVERMFPRGPRCGMVGAPDWAITRRGPVPLSRHRGPTALKHLMDKI